MQATTAKTITVASIRITNSNDTYNDTYNFKAFRLENGSIWIPGESTNDWFFPSADTYQPNGTDVNEDIEDEGEMEMPLDRLAAAIYGSGMEFGYDTIPVEVLKYYFEQTQS